MDRRDPEYRGQRELAVLLQMQNWRDGLIGDATLVRSLMLLGYADDEARVALNLLMMEGVKRCRVNGQ